MSVTQCFENLKGHFLFELVFQTNPAFDRNGNLQFRLSNYNSGHVIHLIPRLCEKV